MKKIVKELLMFVILIAALYFAYNFYDSNNYNYFSKGEANLYATQFTRDNNVKYSKERSYKITSEEFNDAMFYQSIKVEKNTPYKVSCMVKTNDVQSENNVSGAGAQISIEGTTERSMAVAGTQDWQKIEFIFNSKNREEVNLGFRLGGYLDKCRGEAWFTDFKIEQGNVEQSNTNWNFACFIFDTVNATLSDGKQVNYTLNSENLSDIESTTKRFQKACTTLSNSKMIANCDSYKIDVPITHLSYSDEYGYFVAPEDVEAQIKETIDANNYDHIFIIFKLDDNEVKDWIGLGAMDYYGVGFSNIRLPNEKNNYMYKYDVRINTFPEEVLLHEYLHSLERTLIEYGYDIPALHDNQKYGYNIERLIGLKKWYSDYMTCSIKSDSGLVGLNEIVYTLKPAKKSNFDNSFELENPFNEPQNVMDKMTILLHKAKDNVEKIKSTANEIDTNTNTNTNTN